MTFQKDKTKLIYSHEDPQKYLQIKFLPINFALILKTIRIVNMNLIASVKILSIFKTGSRNRQLTAAPKSRLRVRFCRFI